MFNEATFIHEVGYSFRAVQPSRHIVPSSLLVCREQKSRERDETAREPRLRHQSRDRGKYMLTTASAQQTTCIVTGQLSLKGQAPARLRLSELNFFSAGVQNVTLRTFGMPALFVADVRGPSLMDS